MGGVVHEEEGCGDEIWGVEKFLVQAILGEDGSERIEGALEFSDEFHSVPKDYREQEDLENDNLDELKQEKEMVALLT